jgi:hypothetical protein
LPIQKIGNISILIPVCAAKYSSVKGKTVGILHNATPIKTDSVPHKPKKTAYGFSTFHASSESVPKPVTITDAKTNKPSYAKDTGLLLFKKL